MRKLLSILCAVMVVTSFAQSKKKKEIAGYTKQDYEIACIGVGSQGTKLISVYGYGKDPDKAVRMAKVNAIHGIIFKGAPASGGGCQGIKPLAKSVTVEQEFKDFFNKFFAPGGPYLSFVGMSGQGGNNRDVTKVDKKTYKVGIAVSVNYDALRKELENAGIVKGLSSGF